MCELCACAAVAVCTAVTEWGLAEVGGDGDSSSDAENAAWPSCLSTAGLMDIMHACLACCVRV